jgi:hypothetical protein
VNGAGTPLNAGAVVSTTVIVKVLALAGLRLASVALQVTVLLPKLNVDPEAGAQFAEMVPSTVSVAVTAG